VSTPFSAYTVTENQSVPALRKQPGTRPEPMGGPDMRHGTRFHPERKSEAR